MSRDLDPQALRSFLAVAETASFTRAAHQVNRSQSAVSVHIRKLEDGLGTTLFERGKRSVRLTVQGEALQAHAVRILRQHEQAVDELASLAVAGTVRIGVMEDYATHVLPVILSRFKRRFRKILVEVTTGMTAQLIGELGQQFDLVLATQPAGAGHGQIMRTETLGWAFSKSEPLPSGDVLELALLKPGNLFRRWALEALDAAGRPWRIVFTSTSIAAVEAVAEAGLALTVVKRRTARSGLRIIDDDAGLPKLPTAEIALYRAPGPPTSAVTQLAQHLEAALSSGQ